jgi:vesicle coat complex subunit
MSLVARLADPDPEVREDALISLSVKDEPADDELRALANLLRDDSQRLREAAAQTLQDVAKTLHHAGRVCAVLPAERLLPALADRSAEVRQIVLQVLYRYPPNDRLRAAAEELLNDPVGLVRVRAAAVLWAQTQDEVAVRSVVDAAVRSGERDAVIYGCHLLMELGPAAGDIAPLVWEYLRHPDAMVRGNAAYAVFKCCRDRRVLAEAAELVECKTGDSLDNALVGYAAHKLRKAAEAEPGAAADGGGM